jgi:hypothetical protein
MAEAANPAAQGMSAAFAPGKFHRVNGGGSRALKRDGSFHVGFPTQKEPSPNHRQKSCRTDAAAQNS